MAGYRIEFYGDENGDQPVLRWLREELSREHRYVLGTAMREVLQEEGVAVCGTEYGRHLGDGLFEFRVRGNLSEYIQGAEAATPPDEKFLLRVFCHAHGDKLVLLLAGYDKLAHPSKSYQNAEIKLARQRLRAWKLRQKKASP
jgi:hypothetical protein